MSERQDPYIVGADDPVYAALAAHFPAEEHKTLERAGGQTYVLTGLRADARPKRSGAHANRDLSDVRIGVQSQTERQPTTGLLLGAVSTAGSGPDQSEDAGVALPRVRNDVSGSRGRSGRQAQEVLLKDVRKPITNRGRAGVSEIRMSVEMADSMVVTGPLVIDLDGRVVTVDGEDIALSFREWQVLAYLAGRIGKFCSIEDLFWRVHAPDMIVGRHRVDGMDNLVRTTVWRLKTRLGQAGPLIQNRYWFGYRLRVVEHGEATA